MNVKADNLIYFSFLANTPVTSGDSWQDIFPEKAIQGQFMKESFYQMTSVTEPSVAADSIVAVRKLRNFKLSTEIIIQNMELVQ